MHRVVARFTNADSKAGGCETRPYKEKIKGRGWRSEDRRYKGNGVRVYETSRLLRTEEVALDFACGGFGEFAYEAEFVGTFEGGEAGAEPAVDFAV